MQSEGEKAKRLSRTTALGLIIGAILLGFSVFPALPWKSMGSPAVVDVQIATPFPLQSGLNQFPVNHTRFIFERRAVFFEFTFSGLNSSANILLLLPFRINNVTEYNVGTTTPFVFYLKFGVAVDLGDNYWLANATLANDYGYSKVLLNGTLGMRLSLSDDFMNMGPWQSSLQLSFGSTTSPLSSRRCPADMACLSVFRRSSVTVSVGFPHNQIIGDGTFPGPNYIATTEYGRHVVWNFSSSNHFNDLQLFLVANSFAWELPLPFVAQPIMAGGALVILELFITLGLTQLMNGRKKPQERLGKDAPESPVASQPQKKSTGGTVTDSQEPLSPTSGELMLQIDSRLRLGKLDSALLFLSSSVGLIFGIVQSLSSPVEGLLLSIPVIILGWGFPFYFGYFVGAVVRNAAIDRFRGWIFFFAGLGSYGFLLFFQPLTALIPETRLSSLVSALLSLPFAAIAIILGKRLRNLIFETANEDFSLGCSESAKSTMWAAFFIAVLSSALARLRTSDPFYLAALLVVSGVSVRYLWRSERYARMARVELALVSRRGRYFRASLVKPLALGQAIGVLVLLAIFALVTVVNLGESITFALGVSSMAIIAILVTTQRLFGTRKVITRVQEAQESVNTDEQLG